MKDAAQLLNDLRKEEDDGNSLKDLVRCCLSEFEGPQGIARELKKLFDAANTPSSNKQRILSDLIKIWLSIEGTDAVPETMDKADLEAELNKQLVKLKEEESA